MCTKGLYEKTVARVKLDITAFTRLILQSSSSHDSDWSKDGYTSDKFAMILVSRGTMKIDLMMSASEVRRRIIADEIHLV